MSLAALASIAEIIGSAGVIASLLYLARQVKQAQVTANAQYFRDSTSGYRDIALLIASSEEVASIWKRGCDDLASLSEEERRRFTYLLSEILLHYTDVFNAHDKGLMDTEHFQSWEGYVAMVLNQPGAARHWEDALQGGWHPDVRASLNRARRNVPDLRSVFWPSLESGDETAL